MTTLFITRHPGAREWAGRQGFEIDQLVEHLDPADIRAGDTVLGSLPVNLAAEVCGRGGRYFHLTLPLPPEWRGRELSADDMERFGARLEEFRVIAVAAEEGV
jgi:CRISPR-associated protein Csx16